MSADEAWEILRRAPVGHLGTVGPDGWPYVVPVFFVVVDGTIYLHSARSGHKLDNLRANPRVCLQVEELVGLVRPPHSPCEASAYYRSVVVFGTARTVEAGEERAAALRELVRKYLPGGPDYRGGDEPNRGRQGGPEGRGAGRPGDAPAGWAGDAMPVDRAEGGGGPRGDAEDCCVVSIDPEVVTGKAHLPRAVKRAGARAARGGSSP